MPTLEDFLARILNPNPGMPVNRMVNPGGFQSAPYLPQTGLGPEDLARFHQASGMGTAPQGAPPAAFAPEQAPMAPNIPQAAPAAPQASSGGGFLSRLFGGQDDGKNQTLQWLTQQGLDEGTAAVLASDKQSLQSYIRDKVKGGGASEFDQRAQAAQQYGLDPTSPEGRAFILSGDLPEARGGAAEMSLNTIPGVDEEGNAILIQVDKAGVGHKTALPSGVTIARPPIVKDTGTEFQVMDPITREIIQSIPKNVAGAAAAQEAGKLQGAAEFDLPRVEQNANQTLGLLKRMKNHPGRAGSTGFIEGLLPSRSSDQVDFQSLVDQTQGQSFLQAFQMLKGGGMITEIEGEKATDAISRLRNQRLGDEDYLRAITDLEGVITAGLERARQQAGVKTPGFTRNDVQDLYNSETPAVKGDRVAPSQERFGGRRLRFNPETGALE